MDMDQDTRITRLEENLCFVETELQGLGEVLAAQQSQLDALSKELRLIQSRLCEALDMMESGQAPVNPVPPHHVVKLW